MMELCLRVAKRIQQQHVFVFFWRSSVSQSTTQQALMPLSDVVDLHVSELPRGGGNWGEGLSEQ